MSTKKHHYLHHNISFGHADFSSSFPRVIARRQTIFIKNESFFFYFTNCKVLSSGTRGLFRDDDVYAGDSKIRDRQKHARHFNQLFDEI